MSSWVIIKESNGKAVFETFDKATAEKAATYNGYKSVPIAEYLYKLSADIKRNNNA